MARVHFQSADGAAGRAGMPPRERHLRIFAEAEGPAEWHVRVTRNLIRQHLQS